MSARSIVLLRHGRTAYNATGRLQGQVDIPLDEIGQWQADVGAKALADAHTAARIVSSDLTRAAETARTYAQAIGREAHLDPRLRERSFGAWEGLTGAEIDASWPEAFRAWRQGKEPAEVGAETKASVAARMLEAISEHIADLDATETLVIVSHGAAITVTIAALLGQDPASWRGVGGLDNVHWSHVTASATGANPAWRLGGHNIGASYSRTQWNAGPIGS